MERERRTANRNRRVHIVLVPGFAGFDALGQLEYYAGVTPAFRAWTQGDERRRHVVLHYFDNFPTAAVATRADRLRSYLAKRIARGEFQDGDEVALVGHSTGGLDIRRLLANLIESPGEETQVDGGRAAAVRVGAETILGFVRRVVFLSVPQWGTNIADWVRTYCIARTLLVEELRVTVAASDLPLVDTFERWITKAAADCSHADLFRAVRDALTETDPALGTRGPARTASAHEASSELSLWLRHIASDFAAIDDLATKPEDECAGSPAHFTPEMREKETSAWKQYRLQKRSYATLGRRPFQFTGPKAPRWDLANPCTYPECGVTSEIDTVYRACYRACAGGPFDQPAPPGASVGAMCLNDAQRDRIASWGGQDTIELWDNDGIVNTASMLWPDGEKTVLVPGDHMDIVGHYHRVCAKEGQGRVYQAYDLLGSASGFDDRTFTEVWNDVFTWCCV